MAVDRWFAEVNGRRAAGDGLRRTARRAWQGIDVVRNVMK